jgi:plasmid stabilization system protein ParE
MRVVFTALAAKELQDAMTFYEMEFAGLAAQFSEEVRSTIDRVVRHPTGWSVERGEVRRCLLQRFPYKILYSLEPDHVLIIAVAHLHRRPDYWVEGRRG